MTDRPLIPDDSGRLSEARHFVSHRLVPVNTEHHEYSYALTIRTLEADGRRGNFQFDGPPEAFLRMAQEILDALEDSEGIRFAC